MVEESDITLVGGDVRRIAAAYETLRTDLEPYLHPKALSRVLDQAADAVQKRGPGPSGDVLREMRALVAGMMLDRVGQFLTSTDPDRVERSQTYRSPSRLVA